MGKDGAPAMVKAAVSQGVSGWACAVVMRGWMACSAGREAVEVAAAPYCCDTRVRSRLSWRRRAGLEVGAGLPSPLGREDQADRGRDH